MGSISGNGGWNAFNGGKKVTKIMIEEELRTQ